MVELKDVQQVVSMESNWVVVKVETKVSQLAVLSVAL